MCSNPNCRCPKPTFTPRQLKMEGSGFKSFMKKVFKGIETAWSRYSKPAVIAVAPIVGSALDLKINFGWENINLTDNYNGSGLYSRQH